MRPEQNMQLVSLQNPSGGWLGRLVRPGVSAVERLLCIDRLNGIYDHTRGDDGWHEMLQRVLCELAIGIDVSSADLERIPRSGPAIIAANHPFGALDGIALAKLLGDIRGDVKMLANRVLSRIEGLGEVMIHADVFGASTSHNAMAARQALRHLKKRGLLVVFPAGEVSRLELSRRRVIDRPWSDSLTRMARLAGAPVIPVHIDGRGSALFHAVGLIHGKLRTALLARELFKSAGRKLSIQIGVGVPARRLEKFDSDSQGAAYIRQRCYGMTHRATPRPLPPRQLSPVIAQTPLAAQERELMTLPPDQRLTMHRELSVYIGRAAQMPFVMREIGRLREIAFRAEKEGTGQTYDLDRFDSGYQHLVLWSRMQREIVGAYRLAPTDLTVIDQGPGGLYTSTLFCYGTDLLTRISPTIELGRSFIRPEYQRSFAPLLTLWRGIGEYLVRNPRYRYLFGPVSISAAYSPASRELMRRVLLSRFGDAELASLVKPWRTPAIVNGVEELAAVCEDEEDLSAAISDIEAGPGLPVLVRQYLKLGAKFLSFNIDRAFADSMDGLIVVDLMKTDPRTLAKYMGAEGLQTFYETHHIKTPAVQAVS